MGGGGFIPISNQGGTSSVKGIVLEMPTNFADSVKIPSPQGGWAMEQTGTLVTLSGGSLRPGQGLSLQFNFTRNFPSGTVEVLENKTFAQGDLPNVTISLPPFKPDVEFVVFVGNEKVEEHALKMSFELDSKVSLNGVRVMSNGGGRSLSVKSVSVSLDLYFMAKMILGEQKRKIGGRSFGIEGLTLNEREIRG